ncbi:hypothetical protein ACFR99_15410 [Haloarchaeobius amylolyticus]|uniref:Uncharacterized protein n=1 Tax=Haloarchaeobius amylolyticus TaxID=1198296 RepID=A0ABD6BIY8_9EURY
MMPLPTSRSPSARPPSNRNDDLDLETAHELHSVGRERLQSVIRERARATETGLSVDFT